MFLIFSYFTSCNIGFFNNHVFYLALSLSNAARDMLLPHTSRAASRFETAEFAGEQGELGIEDCRFRFVSFFQVRLEASLRYFII